ncbi:hypothetical protein [Piscibacillus halophilus]|uniref:class III lanthionine synthetase LanKC N-terminal domain-containing protein n=1 Tax=Piscibacillus halophilus TaxID=571933 RepID=UPI00158A749F|nr:hypothetical protein [Piscibacillus halophilus]
MKLYNLDFSISEEIKMIKKDMPTNYKLTESDHWATFQNKNKQIPEQGWKIHISSNYYDCIYNLREIYPILFNCGVAWKTVFHW